MDLHTRIRDRRKRQGMTGLKLARKAGVSPSYISLIEHGEKIPSERVAVRIARALGDREDLYRAWAATSRMDEQTRRAVVTLGAGHGTGSALPIPYLHGDGRREAARHDLRIDLSLIGRESADGLVAMRVEERHCTHAPRGIGPGDVVVIDRGRRHLSDGVLLALRIGSDVRIVRARLQDGRLSLPGTGEGNRPAPLAAATDGDDVVLGTIVWSARSW